ncbi:hypothetical protein D8863_09920 [Streptococcus oralis]|uniref:Uncharacterized protein n=1 Tax=Streptococcus oralis TaxID=1303 RepID=A0A428BKD4_STROR|nr:hypothetical protein [Streptococcus oralis]RSI63977.1 hypothetical protein D8863_09920 [Streptococcus oralis]
MYAIYKQNKFEAEYENKHEVILYSRVKFKDFQNYISPWGRISDNVFTKNVKMEELDYLYSIHYEIQYKGHSFYVSSGMIRRNVEKDWFEIKPSANQNQIKDELGFKQINKLEWAKEISRKDIEVLKIVETPLGIFKDQGVKVKSLEGQDIDNFLNSIEK